MTTNFKKNSSDLLSLFSSYSSGNKASITGYKINGIDICNTISPYTLGSKVTTIGYKINGVDVSNLFQNKLVGFKNMSYGLVNNSNLAEARTIGELSNGNIIIGGGFLKYGTNVSGGSTGTAIKYLAIWNGTTLRQFGTGNEITAPVGDIAVDGSDVYIVGNFTTVNGAVGQRILKTNTDGTTFTPLSTTFNAYISFVRIDTFSNPKRIYILGGNNTGRLYYYSNNTWSAGIATNFNNTIQSIDIDNSTGNLYASGVFTSAGSPGNRVAVYNNSTSSWGTFGDGGIVGTQFYAIKFYNNKVYIGGLITSVGTPSISVNNIAVCDLSTGKWSAMGSGLSGGQVNTIETDLYGNVYAGGLFTSSGSDSTVKYLAKWNSTTNLWEGLATGINGNVNQNGLFFSSNNNMYVCGNFYNFASYTNSASVGYYGL
jgi:hypothetical protein